MLFLLSCYIPIYLLMSELRSALNPVFGIFVRRMDGILRFKNTIC